MSHFSIKGNYRIQELKDLYKRKNKEISCRLKEFQMIWKEATDEKIFAELVFCILTPQASGKLCWAAVETMTRKGILYNGDTCQITEELSGARFIHKKSAYIVEARERFYENGKVCLKTIINTIGNGQLAREWLVHNIKGIGYKEASHFLRNIGFDQDLAILDRHIIKNLELIGVIGEIPGSLSRKRYLDIEKRMMEFSRAVRIPMSHLDLLMWYRAKGEVFK